MQNKRRLFIIGASYFGRDMESWLERISINQRDWKLMGYLHSFDNKSPLEGYPTDYKILGGWEDYPLTQEDYCIIAVSDCSWKEKIYNQLKGHVSFYTYIAPDAIIGKFNQIGEGAIICPKSLISTNVKIGTCVTIISGTQIGHDVIVGDFSSIMGGISLNGSVNIGKKVFIGTKATVIPKIQVEEGATVGAGSVVIRRVKSNTTVFGNPAKRIENSINNHDLLSFDSSKT